MFVKHEDHEGRPRLLTGLTTADIKTPSMSGHWPIVHDEEDEPKAREEKVDVSTSSGHHVTEG
jgi:hypothetical protein